MKNFSKYYSLRTYLWNRIVGHISFPRSTVGQFVFLENGNKAEIFRHVIFRRPHVDDAEAVLFHVTFHLKNMSPRMNKIFSNFPIPLFAGLPGFCAKFWCIDTSNGDCHGFYKWQSKEHAEAYANSFAMKFMSKRSIPESIDFEISAYRGNKYNAYPDIP